MMEAIPRLANDLSQKTLEKPGRTGLLLLEKAFRGWEDLALRAAANARSLFITTDKNINSGVVRNFPAARRFILEQGSSSGPVQGLENFIVNEGEISAERATTKATREQYQHGPLTESDVKGSLEEIDNYFLPQLLAWTRDSRRVFSLDRESTMLHAQNKYDDFTWGDVLMPFPSFMIELKDTPVGEFSINGKKMAINGILVTHLADIAPQFSDEDSFECRVFYTDLSGSEPGVSPVFTSSMRKHAEQIAEGNFTNGDEYMREEEERFHKNTSVYVPPTGQAFHIDLSEPITSESLGDETNIIRKIVAGTCLYLAHAPGKIIGMGDIRGETWHKTIETGKKLSKKITPQNLILNESQIFTIKNVHEFNPRTGKVRYTDQTGREVEVHARRAHLRRKPRTPIDAKKDVEVASAWIHRKQLPRDALPMGAVTILKSAP